MTTGTDATENGGQADTQVYGSPAVQEQPSCNMLRNFYKFFFVRCRKVIIRISQNEALNYFLFFSQGRGKKEKGSSQQKEVEL